MKIYLVMFENPKNQPYKRGHNPHTDQRAKGIQHITILNKCRKVSSKSIH